jgi:WD40 repeat protein/tetratricopeptide (TPR) repeat protein
MKALLLGGLDDADPETAAVLPSIDRFLDALETGKDAEAYARYRSDLAERLDNLAAYRVIVDLLGRFFRPPDAVPHLEDPKSREYVLASMAIARGYLGDFEDAIGHYETIFDLCSRRYCLVPPTFRGNYAHFCMARGDLATAESILGEQLDQCDDPSSVAYAHLHYGLLLSYCGELDEARSYLRVASSMAWARGWRWLDCHVHSYRAVRAELAGEQELRLVCARRALSVAAGDRRLVLRARILLGRALVASGSPRTKMTAQFGEAERHLNDALTSCRRLGLRELEMDALLGVSELRRAGHDLLGAVSAGHIALDLAHRCGARLKEVDAHLLLANLHEEFWKPSVSRTHAAAALEIALSGDPGWHYAIAATEARRRLAAEPRRESGANAPRPTCVDAADRPSRADRLNDEAVGLLEADNIDQGIERLDEALVIDPFHIHAVYNRALALWRLGRTTDEGAVGRLVGAARERPEGGRASFLLGLLLAEAGDEDGARARFAEAIRTAGGEPSLVVAARAAMRELVPSLCLLHRLEVDGEVEAVAIAAGGEIAASAGDGVDVWSVPRGTRMHSLKAPYATRFQAVAITPDGRRVAAGDRRGTIFLWDVRSGEVLAAAVEEELSWSAVSVSADARIAVASSGGLSARYGWSTLYQGKRAAERARRDKGWESPLRVWNLAASRRESLLEGHRGAITELWLAPDGESTVAVTSEGDILLFRLSEPSRPHKVRAHDGRVNSLAVDGTSTRALTGGADGTLRVWELPSLRCTAVLRGHRKAVRGAGFGPTAEVALSAGAEGTLCLWDLEHRRCLRSLTGFTTRATKMAVSGARAVTSGEKRLTFWAIARPPRSPFIRSHEPAAPPSATTGTETTLQTALLAVAGGDPAQAAARLDALREGGHRSRTPETLRLWEALRARSERGPLRGAWERATLEGHEGEVRAVDISSDGHVAVSAAADGTLRVWDTETGQCIRVLRGHEGPVLCIALDASGRLALTGGADHTTRVWDIGAGRAVRVLRGKWLLSGHGHAVTCLWLDDDGRFGATADEHGHVIVWDVITGQDLARTSVHGRPLSLRGVGRDDIAVVTEGEQRTALWDPWREGRLWAKKITDLAPDLRGGPDLKRFMATRRGTYFYSFWSSRERPSGVPFALIRDDPSLGDYPVPPLAMTPLGDVAIHAAGPDIAVCDGELGKRIDVLRGHSGVVHALALSSDGRLVISGGSDGTARLWYLEWGVKPAGIADWDDRAEPLLQEFVRRALWGPPGSGRALTDADARLLMTELSWAGFGWLRPEAVRRRLQRAWP